MAVFFEGDELSKKIKSIVGGKKVRCAVAFWGNGSDWLFIDSLTKIKNAKIVCDISMGCTSDKALIKLNAPNNKNLRHHNNFHSKIYISDIGAIIASANASNNGIGLNKRQRKLEEAGIFLDPIKDKKAYESATLAFERYFDNSVQVDNEALLKAKNNWKSRQRNKISQETDQPNFKGSILSLIKSNPELFRGIGFAIFYGSINPKIRDEARKNALEIREIAASIEMQPEKLSKESLDVSSFNFDEVPNPKFPNDAFPSKFVSFYLTKTERLVVDLYERIVPTFKMPDPDDPENKNYYVAVAKKLDWKQLNSGIAKAAIDKNLSEITLTKKEIQLKDGKAIWKLLHKDKHVFADANSFREFLVAV